MSDSTDNSTQEQQFDAELELHPTDGGVFLTVPFSVAEVYGVKGQLHVRGTIDGFPFRLPLTPVANGEHILTIRKQIRNTIDKTWGGVVHVVLAPDTDEQTLELPSDLARALDNLGLRPAFGQLAYNQRKEYVQWITRAKKSAVRADRLQELLEILRTGTRPH